MKFSINWLKEFIDFKESPQTIAEKLTLAGFEVEKIEERAKKLKNIVIGEILDIKKHPKADKLQLVEVKTKEGIKNIVCGASNIKKGQKVPVALAGATLVNMEIKEAEIRGIKSSGMLCAEDEIGIGEDHSGIYILNPEVKIADGIKRVLNLDDVILETNITPNRGDCFSILGIARELSAILNRNFKNNFRKLSAKLNYSDSQINGLKIEVKDKDLCPKYTAAKITGVKIKESPEWLKARLRASGIRPINNVADITNYVMLELGQPLHAFDFDKLKNNGDAKIIIRKSKKGEKINTIDNKERELEEGMLVIANSLRPVAVAGIMGGEESEISDETKDIILESAQFDAASIRQTSKKLGLRSDSSMRFERKVDWNITEIAMERALELIKELGGGEIEGRLRIAKSPRYLRTVININADFISKLLGVEVSKEKIKNTFLSLGLKVSEYAYKSKLSKQKIQNRFMKEAKKVIGKPYKYGAKESESPKCFDCSSFVQYLYKKLGIIIPRCSIEQAEIGREVKRSELQIGDLIFTSSNHLHYSYNFKQGIGHAALYIGRNKIIHADSSHQKVIAENLKDFFKERNFVVAKRIIGQEEEKLIVTVPSWREDLKIKEDLAEEVGRIYDYNKMRPANLKAELKAVLLDKKLALENKIKDVLAGFGFDEVYNYSFYKAEGKDGDKHFKVINPLNPDQEFLRITLRPKIEENLEKNLKFFDEVKIFEIGNVFLKNNGLPEERRKIIAAIALKDSSATKEKIFKYLKGAFEALADKINIELNSLNYQKEGNKIRIKIDNETTGDFEVEKNRGNFELDLAGLAKYSRENKIYKKISPYPPVIRDLAIVLDKNIPHGKISEIIKKTSFLIQNIELFDIFESEKLGKGKRGLAYRLVFQSFEKTFASEEIEGEIKRILDELSKTLGAKLRE